MCKILAVTNAPLCKEGLEERIELIAPFVDGVILREKYLAAEEYLKLAEKILKICKSHNILCIFHTFYGACERLENPNFHAPAALCESLDDGQKKRLAFFGASCHSVAEAKACAAAGCNYLLAGHVFATDCKKGLAPRGVDFLKAVCASVTVPVYALGGITDGNAARCVAAGAAGVAVMSGAMTCADPEKYFSAIREGLKCR